MGIETKFRNILKICQISWFYKQNIFFIHKDGVVGKMGWWYDIDLDMVSLSIRKDITTRHGETGVGYKGKDDEWLKHYDAFENVLAALNSENNSTNNSANNSPVNSPVNSATNSPATSEDEDEETKSRKSLENRSKSSRARVHYHKFTRGKDLSRYNEDDLACILGSKKSKRNDPNHNAVPEEEVKVEAIEKEKEEFIGDEVGSKKKEHGLVTIAGGNYQEYFAMKMAALKKKREGNGNVVNETQDKIHGEEQLSPIKSIENTSLEAKKSKKKKKKYKDNEDSITFNDSNVDQKEDNCTNTNENMPKERKKKKRKTEDSNSNMLENNDIKEDNTPLFGFGFSCGFTNGSTVKKYPINTVNVFNSDDEAEITKDDENLNKNVSPQYHSPKDKKKKHNKDPGLLDESLESKEKKKKKKSKDNIYETEDLSLISKNENSENASEELIKKTKKKKHKNKDEVEKVSIVIENENATEFEENKKVKKKKNKEQILSNDCLTENTDTIKKKKKKKKNLVDNSEIMEECSTDIKNDEKDENVHLKENRKSKKRKREDEETGTDNSSSTKKFKKSTDGISEEVSQGKNKLKRKEYIKKQREEISKKKKERKQARKQKRCENKDTMAKKVFQAFEGAKVPNIMTKRDKKKLEQSRVP
ncbi:unnamed protein product, partial [Meganyctiphanes norvegica]